MLALNRKLHERIYLDIPPGTERRQVIIEVVRLGEWQVKLGIEASDEITILRDDAVNKQEVKP